MFLHICHLDWKKTKNVTVVCFLRSRENTFWEVIRKCLFLRCNPTGRPSTAQTCWTILAAWLCLWWASCCWPPSWSWLWLRTADWPDTSSLACVLSPTAGPSIRTCLPHVNEGEAREAAVADKGLRRGTGRVVCGFRKARKVEYGPCLYNVYLWHCALFSSYSPINVFCFILESLYKKKKNVCCFIIVNYSKVFISCLIALN